MKRGKRKGKGRVVVEYVRVIVWVIVLERVIVLYGSVWYMYGTWYCIVYCVLVHGILTVSLPYPYRNLALLP